MKFEKIQELSAESGATRYEFPIGVATSFKFSTNDLVEFVRLVEQETLERAAKHFDDRGKHADGSWSSGWYDPESPGIILRALKDSND